MQSPSQPSWVIERDVPNWSLTINESAKQTIQQLLESRSLKYYQNYDEYLALLSEVLVQDVRSVHQGRGSSHKEGGTKPYVCRIDDVVLSVLYVSDETIRIVDAKFDDSKTQRGDDENLLEKEDQDHESAETGGDER